MLASKRLHDFDKRKIAYYVVGIAAAVLLFVAGGRLMLNALERQLIYFPTRTRVDTPTPRLATVLGWWCSTPAALLRPRRSGTNPFTASPRPWWPAASPRSSP